MCYLQKTFKILDLWSGSMKSNTNAVIMLPRCQQFVNYKKTQYYTGPKMEIFGLEKVFPSSNLSV